MERKSTLSSTGRSRHCSAFGQKPNRKKTRQAVGFNLDRWTVCQNSLETQNTHQPAFARTLVMSSSSLLGNANIINQSYVVCVSFPENAIDGMRAVSVPGNGDNLRRRRQSQGPVGCSTTTSSPHCRTYCTQLTSNWMHILTIAISLTAILFVPNKSKGDCSVYAMTRRYTQAWLKVAAT